MGLNMSAYIAADSNDLITTLTVTGNGTGPLELTITLAQTNGYGLPTGAGIATAGPSTYAWTAKGGVIDTHNSAILMPCDAASFIVHPSVRTFAPDAGAGRRVDCCSCRGVVYLG